MAMRAPSSAKHGGHRYRWNVGHEEGQPRRRKGAPLFQRAANGEGDHTRCPTSQSHHAARQPERKRPSLVTAMGHQRSDPPATQNLPIHSRGPSTTAAVGLYLRYRYRRGVRRGSKSRQADRRAGCCASTRRCRSGRQIARHCTGDDDLVVWRSHGTFLQSERPPSTTIVVPVAKPS
jgi:hypothetical protein